MRAAAVSLALLLSGAGCLSPGDAGDDAPFHAQWSELALQSGTGHDHADPLQHAGLTTPNFEVLGHEPLFSEFYGGQSAGGYVCGDAGQGSDGRRIAAVESRSKVGFALADVTDPRAPRWLGELVMESTYVYDLAVVPGNQFVVLVTRHAEAEGLPNVPPLAPQMSWRTPCDAGPRTVADLSPQGADSSPQGADLPTQGADLSPEDPVPRPLSLVLVDISDPATPAIVDQHPLLGFGHSAYSAVLGGETLLLVTTLGPSTAAGSPSAFELYAITDTPAGARLEPRSVYRPPPADGPLPANPLVGRSGHDGWMASHPGTGQSLAYLVGADLLTILDIGDSRAPRVLGTWSEAGPGRAGYAGSLHSVVPLAESWNGRHFTIVGPEWGGHPTDHPSGIVWVLDTTDPAAPFEVAAWTLPHEVEWNGTYMFSNHYYGVVGRTLFVSMYHGGVWAVDLSPLDGLGPPGGLEGPGPAPLLLLASIGAFLPTDPGADPAVEVRWTPNSQEVLPFADGTMVTFDSWTGLWTFRFDASRPAPAPEPWPIQPVH